MILEDKIKYLINTINNLYFNLNIENIKLEIIEEEKKINSNNFWNDIKKAKKNIDNIKFKKKYVENYKKVKIYSDDLEVFFNLFKEGEIDIEELKLQIEITEKVLSDIKFKNILYKKEDLLGAILQISSGAGGIESCDWAYMLSRMYSMWGEKNNYKIKKIHHVSNDIVGIKSITLEIKGKYAFGFLKGENGVHRLVRISPFDSNSKRHTSFASVYVYPLIEKKNKINIKNSDIIWDTFRSSGSGGQNVNKVETGVRLKHKSTGIIVENTESRSQFQNKEKAIQILKSKLLEKKIKDINIKRDEIESKKKKIEWGSQIRSYIMHPYKLVKDLRTNYKTSNINSVMNGGIENFIKEFLIYNKENIKKE